MTREQFISNHGPAYAELLRSHLFADLLLTIDEASTARKAPDEPLVNAVAAEGTLLGQIRGWEALRKFLTSTIIEPAPAKRRADDYSTSQV